MGIDPGSFELSKGILEMETSCDSGIPDLHSEVLCLETMRTDCSATYNSLSGKANALLSLVVRPAQHLASFCEAGPKKCWQTQPSPILHGMVGTLSKNMSLPIA